jgi:PAS domain S-box-containing protein
MAKLTARRPPVETDAAPTAAPMLKPDPRWLAALVDSSSEAIISKAMDGTITSWNAAAEKMYGYQAAEMLGRSIQMIVPEDRLEELRLVDEKLVRGERVASFETVRVTRDGRRIDIALTISPIIDARGMVVGSSGICHDISARLSTEDELRRSQRDLRDFVENSAVGLHWVGPDGIVLWANQTELDMLGYRREEYIGRHIADFHADQPVIADILERLLRTEQLNNYEARLRCKNGSIRHVLISSNVYSERGEFIHTRCITNDITDRKRAEILLAAQKRALELIASGGPLEAVLETLVRAFEERSIYGALASVLLLDDDGVHLRHGAAPSLPEAYNRAIDRVAIGPAAGSCGTAAFRREAVIASDIASDPLWRDFRELALRHGLRSCWSVPILARDDQVLGTYAIYYREPRAPSAEDLQVLSVLARTAAIAVEAKRADAALRESERHLRRILDSLAAMVVVTTPDGTVLEVNRTALELAGLTPGDVLGKPLEKTWWWSGAPERQAELRAAIAAAAAGAESRFDVRLRVAGERHMTFDFMLTPLIDQRGRVTHLIPSAIDVTARKRAERQQQLLIEELNHRVKNTLAIAQSLTNQTLRSSPSPTSFAAAFQGRLAALASAHTLLAQTRWDGAMLRDLIQAQLDPYRTAGRSNVTITGEDVSLEPDAALTLGLALHELATNAAKHGAFTCPAGRVEIASQIDGSGPERRLVLTWSEQGGPAVAGDPQAGFGTTMIQRGLAYQLGGSAQLEFRPQGVHCRIELPLADGRLRAQMSAWLDEDEEADGG